MFLARNDFASICESVLNAGHPRFNIGTYQEKTLHLTIKSFIEPEKSKQEVPYKGFVADIRNEQGIFEIQTSSFGSMRKKLEAFLKSDPVTIVYPVPAKKWVCWIDREFHISKKRLSPKKSTAAELLPNLIYISDYLNHPNLHFSVFLLELIEFKMLNGWGNYGKRGAERVDRIPVDLLEVVQIESRYDFSKVIPFSPAESFTVDDFSRASHLSYKKSYSAVQVLKRINLVTPIGKRSRSILFSVNQSIDNQINK